ncbi:MAG TPA: deoxyguanosinetriphosphate triphosphohydrolase [Gemmataceae bacterium]|nr:deoxyguanosinetriphosphate triphosphohydrolase [Gemmataceae bacterium]
MSDDVPYEPPDWLDWEDRSLAPYAMKTRRSRGRRHPEPPHPYRTLYQRDRDRIVHSTAFRRLMHKTQVLAAQTNDHHRTRLTHTLEVAQIARTVARRLGLNEDLTEAVALSHDLGHPPFGHAGEEALDQCMREHGGFEHNLHALRIVTLLEYRYPDFPGLNLSWETLEAMALHSRRRDAPEAADYTPLPLPSAPSDGGEGRVRGQPPLEAQVADAADSLAYDAHDVDDALSVGLVTVEDMQEVEFWRRASEQAQQRHGPMAPEQFQPTVVRLLIAWQVGDLLEQTGRRIRQERIRSVEDVRAFPEPLVGPGPEVRRLKMELEEFLNRRVYRHYRVLRMAEKGSRIVRMLFEEFRRAPQLLPPRYAHRIDGAGPERVVCDYVAGMTDRYAQDEYLRLFHPSAAV